MTTLLIQTLPDLGRTLLERVRIALASSTDERIRALLPRVPRPSHDDPIRLVATGEYSGGKSSLLKALTGADIEIHAGVTTTETREYPWGNVLLLDTPGVKAGRPLHDELAERALRNADLVIFVITPGLFDPETAPHLCHVAYDLGKLGHMVIVVNKAGTMGAAPGIREAAVREVLGTVHLPVRLIECDARSALGVAGAPDPERAEFLTRTGNMAALEAALNEMVATGRTAARLRLPFQAARQAADDARLLLEPEMEEEALRAVLERHRGVLARSRVRLDNRLEEGYGSTFDRIVAAGEALVAAAHEGAVPAAAVDEFERQARSAAEGLGGKVERALERELAELAAEERGLAEGPEVQTLLDAGMLDFGSAPGQGIKNGPPPGGPSSAFTALVSDYFTARGKGWLDEALQGGTRPGSPLHQLVYVLGKKAGKKFRPWEAVKWAERLNAAISVGLFLFNVWDEIRSLHKEEGEAQRHQIMLRAEVRDAAEALLDEARAQVDPIVDGFFAEAQRPVAEIEERLEALAEERSRLDQELAEVRRECDRVLATLDRSVDGDCEGIQP